MKLTGNSGTASDALPMQQNFASVLIQGSFNGGEVMLQESEDGTTWVDAPASLAQGPTSFNILTGSKFVRLMIKSGSGLDLDFWIKPLMNRE